MSDANLTEQERDAMAHAIGHHSAKGCSREGGRNHYCTAADDPMWTSLVERGFATRTTPRSVGDGNAIFHVTAEGIAVLEADPRSRRRRRRRYWVRFNGILESRACSVPVTADSRGKARYVAALNVTDATNWTVFEALRRIASCRLEAANR